MPRKKCNIFNFFVLKSTASTSSNTSTSIDKNIYQCKFCFCEYKRHATRMKAHIMKCLKCPQELKKALNDVGSTSIIADVAQSQGR